MNVIEKYLHKGSKDINEADDDLSQYAETLKDSFESVVRHIDSALDSWDDPVLKRAKNVKELRPYMLKMNGIMNNIIKNKSAIDILFKEISVEYNLDKE